MARKILTFIVLLIGAYVGYDQVGSSGQFADAPVVSDASWYGGQQVRGEGTVTRVLSDDNEGSRHQRFILRLGSGRTVLVAHNIDLAPRIPGIEVGDRVAFFGEFETNDRGGVIHWTHHDPRGSHPDGWLEHKGQRYE